MSLLPPKLNPSKVYLEVRMKDRKDVKFLIKPIWEICLIFLGGIFLGSCDSNTEKEASTDRQQAFDVPEGYMDEATQIPGFWLTTLEEIDTFIKDKVKKGHVEVVGTSAGGRPILSVSYGERREGEGTTTFSGSLSISDIAYYRGNNSDKLVYMGIAGVHGFELEGIMGVINMISVFETGKDLRGKEQPELASM